MYRANSVGPIVRQYFAALAPGSIYTVVLIGIVDEDPKWKVVPTIPKMLHLVVRIAAGTRHNASAVKWIGMIVSRRVALAGCTVTHDRIYADMSRCALDTFDVHTCPIDIRGANGVVLGRILDRLSRTRITGVSHVADCVIGIERYIIDKVIGLDARGSDLSARGTAHQTPVLPHNAGRGNVHASSVDAENSRGGFVAHRVLLLGSYLAPVPWYGAIATLILLRRVG